ncbi:MAG: hypothetical protein M1608_05020 [Candidatus Omnitrophica bacterium]|nr:hypothetical protein [Candidatus Omnitrophota bacterium]
MSFAAPTTNSSARWLWGIIGLSGACAGAGLVLDARQFGFSYLLAFMFYLSLCLGSMFLVMLHHLFDASWSAPIRRFEEHIAFLLPVMFLLFLPIALLAPRIYPWMNPANTDYSLAAKSLYLNRPFFYLRVLLCFGVWSWLAFKLRYWSIQQDNTGAAGCTHKMRKFAAAGIFLYAVTTTIAAIDWMKSLSPDWYSTMYGVYFFASSAWTMTATAYVLAVVLQRTGHLRPVLTPTIYYYLGSLLLAFTVFYAYIHFAQYFVIWNANVPEETFWYVLREKGGWWNIGLIIVFGHFLVPFLALLRIDLKLVAWWMVALGVWAWVMNFADLAFNIMPNLDPDTYVLHWTDLACLVFLGSVLTWVFLVYFSRHAPYPVKDPRLKEALTHHEIFPPVQSAGLNGGHP